MRDAYAQSKDCVREQPDGVHLHVQEWGLASEETKLADTLIFYFESPEPSENTFLLWKRPSLWFDYGSPCKLIKGFLLIIIPQCNQVETKTSGDFWRLVSAPTDSARAINVAKSTSGTECVLQHQINSNTVGNYKCQEPEQRASSCYNHVLTQDMFNFVWIKHQSVGSCLLIGLRNSFFKLWGNFHEQLCPLLNVNDSRSSLWKP